MIQSKQHRQPYLNINFEKDIYSKPFNPYKILNIDNSQECRQVFISRIASSSYEDKISLTLSMDAISTKEKDRYKKVFSNYSLIERSIQIYALTGNLIEMQKCLKGKNEKNKAHEFGRSLLYICCRSGYYDCVRYLLEIGSDVNLQQENLSTPLHVASFYGHEQIVMLLLSYGSSNQIINQYAHSPSDEAHTVEICRLIKNSGNNKINQLFQQLKQSGHASSIEVNDNKDIIRIYKSGVKKEIFFDYYNDSKYLRAYHGTKFNFLSSIFIYGLKKPGEKAGDIQIQINQGHIQKGISINGVKDWSDAIFISPSPFYSADIAYAERITSESQQYACLVEVFVKDGCFMAAPSTVLNASFSPSGEPTNTEYVVAENEASHILRVNSPQNIIVYSILFIKVKFLESSKDFDKCLKQIQIHKII